MMTLRPLICLLLALTSSTVWAQAAAPGSPRVTIDLAWPQTPLVAGQDAVLGVVLQIVPDWHVQAGKGSGDERAPYIPTTIDLDLPAGWRAGNVTWPDAHTFTLGAGQYAETLAGYEGTVLAAVPIALPDDVSPGGYEVTAKVGYQACDDQVCEMPTSQSVTITATVAEEGVEQSPPADEAIAELFAAALEPPETAGRGIEGEPVQESAEEPAAEESTEEAAGEPSATFEAFERLKTDLAWYEGALVPGRESNLGVILHVAPQWHIQAGEGSGDVKEGDIATEIDLTLPEGWEHDDILWPEAHEFVTGEGEFAEKLKGYEGRVAAVIPVQVPETVEPGVYEISLSVTYQACDAFTCELPETQEATASATVIPEGESGEIAPIPAGIAALIEKTLTREASATPSEAKEDTKRAVQKVAAFLQWWGSAFLVWLAMAWMVVRTFRITPRYLPRTMVLIVALLFSYGVFSFAQAMTAQHDLWVKHSDAAFEEARSRQKIVFIKFTADWCANCQVNERMILANDEAMELLRSPEVVAMKVDFTGPNPDGERRKEAVGGGGIPLITVYHPGVEEPVVIRGQLGSVQPVIDALKTPQVQRSLDTWAFDFLFFQFEVPRNATLIIFGLAFIAGFFMNFTPCVLPVIPLKILSLQAHAKNPARCFFLGLIFGLGIVALYAVLGVLIGLFGLLDWGEQYQNWWVSGPLGLIVGLMGFGMLGLFTIKLPQVVYMFNPQSDSAGGSFSMGVFTAILSTPCTGPLLGAAVAWAATQPRFIAFSTLLMMGFGMAFPYVLLTAKPSWLSKLPRTGPGSELVKQVMGLLLMAVAVYFICTGVLSFAA